LILSGTSNLTGSINANEGIVLLQNPAALGTAAGATIVGAGGELQLADTLAVAAEPLTLNGSGTIGVGALRLVSGNASWSGPITVASTSSIGVDSGVLVLGGAIDLGSALTFTGGGTEQIDGVLSGSGDLLKNGAGTLYLTAANTFSGTTTINGGTLIPQSTAAFGATGAASGTVVTAGGAILLNDATGLNIGAETLALNGSGVAGAGALESIAGDNSWSGDIVLATNSTVSVDANTLTLSGAISESGGARSLTKSGAGTLILDGNNAYTGATQITAGVVQLADADRIGDNSAVVVSAGATLDANDFSDTIGSLAGAGTVNLGATGGNVLWIGNDGSSTTFSGTITGAGDLAKTGTGILTLTGTNDYTGNTMINAGVLAIDSDTRLGNGGGLSFGGGTLQTTAGLTTGRAVTINSGGGTIDTNGNDVVLSGSISGSVDGITKAGAGRLIISGLANIDYTALTTVRAGSLVISGSISGSDVDVQDGATLGGTGTTDDVTAESGGTVAPGITGAGLLSTGNFDLNSGAHLAIELGGTGAGSQYDRVQVTGGLTLAGDLQGSLINGYLPVAGDLFFIIINDGSDAVTGTFNGLAQGGMLDFGGRTFQVSYAGDVATQSFTGGNDVALIVVPEPSAWTMLFGGFGLLLTLQRRKSYWN
ncbi:MAG TPA: autotransporter-associated beta strand repeat-containing protein, partial [Chthoniobacteraceae bacterium]|nr:autotransporter-associated beta strand repeat-containing protein [Chthoniobacteraceae bacterium]